MALLEIEIKLDAKQFKSKSGDVTEIAGKGKVSLDSMAAAATGVAFAYNEVSQALQKVAQVASKPIQLFSQLQSEMANVASLGVPNIENLTDEVLDMGSEIAAPISSLTGGLYEVVSAGVDASHQIEVLDISARAAKAGITETNQALKLGSAIVKGYGLDWSETENVMDKAFQTVKLGQTTFPELASNMGQVVPLASALKINIDELFGSYATLTGVTGNTSEVTTQLRGVMQGLADPTKELTKLVREQTGQTVEQAVESEGLAGVLKILADATGGSAAEMNQYFGRVEAVNAALALSSSQYDTMIEKTQSMTDASGAMNDAFEIQNSTMEASYDLLKNRLNEILVEGVDRMEPFIDSVLNLALEITDTRSEIEKLSDDIDDLNSQFSELEDAERLIERYVDLRDKADKTAEEQRELQEITQKLAETFPDAVTAVDDYGKALSVNSEYIREQIRSQRELLKVTEAEAYDRAKDALQKYLPTLEDGNLMLKMLQGQLENTKKMYGDQSIAVKDAREEYQNFKESLKEANQEMPSTLSLLQNFIDLRNPKAISMLSEELGISGNRLEILNEEIRQYLEAMERVEEPGGDGGDEKEEKLNRKLKARLDIIDEIRTGRQEEGEQVERINESVDDSLDTSTQLFTEITMVGRVLAQAALHGDSMADALERAARAMAAKGLAGLIGGAFGAILGGPAGFKAGFSIASGFEIPGFDEGGSFVVPGLGSGDRPYTLNLEPGELVNIIPKDEINEGLRSIPTDTTYTSDVPGAGVDVGAFMAMGEEIRKAIEQVKIEIKGDMVDYIQFYRDTFEKYQDNEAERKY